MFICICTHACTHHLDNGNIRKQGRPTQTTLTYMNMTEVSDYQATMLSRHKAKAKRQCRLKPEVLAAGTRRSVHLIELGVCFKGKLNTA